MAVQLEELLSNKLSNIRTGPVIPGTVQLTPKGKLICLMADCQVTGGYPRVLQLSTSAMGYMGQRKQGDQIQLKLITSG